jgi:hypothetical protein
MGLYNFAYAAEKLTKKSCGFQIKSEHSRKGNGSMHMTNRPDQTVQDKTPSLLQVEQF